jgi:processive 1,2-diacylglycerol beta-glucosyltransferase
MINLREKGTNKPLGSITEAQLQFLIDQLEEESLEDQDYSVTPLLLEVFESEGADPALISLLKAALGEKEEIEIIWEK